MDLVQLIRRMRDLSEKNRYPNGRGSYRTKSDGKVTAQKSKVKVYPTIKVALGKTGPGAVFSTKGSARLYVTSKRSHGGTDTKSQVSGRIAKGFTPGSSTPSSDFASIKSHAARVGTKHGTKHAQKDTAAARREKDKGTHKDKKVKKSRGH